MSVDDAPVLELLFGVPVERFLVESWPDTPRFAAGSVARFADIVAHPALHDVSTFLHGHRGRACVRGSLDGNPIWSEHAWIDDAPERFAHGELLDLGNVPQRVPDIQRWIDRLVDELSLGFGAHQGNCSAYVGRSGTQVAKHFDHRELFLVQLHGRARWRVAPNDALPVPLATHVAGTPIHPLNVEGDLAALAAPSLSGADEVVLEPGGVIFVPRGYWQATEVLEDSLTLAFAFRVPPWLDLVVHAALAILASEPTWRATVDAPPSQEIADTMDRAIETLTGIDLPRRR